MKKLLFTALSLLIVNCAFTINTQAQNSKIDDFIKNHSSQKGASYVEMSKPILDAAFRNEPNYPGSYSISSSSSSSGTSTSSSVNSAKKEPNNKYPQKFKSLVLADNSKAGELKGILGGKEYEVLMETRNNREDRKTKESYESVTTYYFHNASKADEKEIIIVQQEGDNRLSLTYMQGDLDINSIQNYLLKIRIKLSIMGVENGLTSNLGFNLQGMGSSKQFEFDFSELQSTPMEFNLTIPDIELHN